MGHRAGEEYWKVKDRDRFWEVIAQGGSLAAAAASVGVTRAAGLRWLRNGLIPEWCRQKIIDRVQPGTGPLTFVERGWIQEMCRVGFTTSEMARLLGRSRSTIWRELPKGIHETWGTYRAVVAQRTVDAARARPKTRKLETNDELRAQVVEGLAKNWSPQQIAARLRLDHPGDKEMRVCHETIYQAIYVQPRGGLAREVKAAIKRGKVLRHGREHRKHQGRAKRPDKLGEYVSIHERPQEIEERLVPGHWEGDLIIGAGSASQVGTLVERTTSKICLLHLPTNRTAPVVAQAIITTIEAMNEAMDDIPCKSVTWDQGSEMAAHHQITQATGVQVYFADPHSPWQRGANENTNGLLRDYFPKGTDLSVYPPDYLEFVTNEMNDRPRKRLGWSTPNEAWNELLSNQQPH